MGVDLGDKRSHLCTLDAAGQVISESTIPTSPSAFRKHFLSLPSALVVLEVGPHSRWASELLAGRPGTRGSGSERRQNLVDSSE
ncbi:MAG: hypothetical protein JO182_05655 [Acidobacteriaceae bacterium]|nr:hypothetical protein [Acidobacteriaceae bacterium]MBV9033960.1 hypothetical protein [Acidobacteriaceae bacterium]MBV9307249.1 hypothetical protein [Acidobacteriaceae bacterium]MBV9937608.1 hypothetical protein [Acidobacteriaceae bacterium]